MASRGNAGDTAIVLKTASRDFREEFTPADYGFYSIHRRVTLLPALKSQGIVRNAGRGRYKVTPEGIEWAREQFRWMGPRDSNPGRPPKDWMRRCIKGVEKGSSAADPGAVCGSMWYHKLTPGQKQYRLRKERQGNPYSQFANPWKREY